MGSNRKLIFGAVLVVAGLVFWGLMNALNGVNRGTTNAASAPVAQQVVAPSGGGRMIAYAKSDIPQGALVTKNMFEMRRLQGDGPTTPFVTDPESQALGFVTSTPIRKGDLIRPRDNFAGHISEVGIAGMLLPDRRAIVIPFANKPTLHDLVAIGDRIDINAAFDGQESRTIVPNVRVLAVDVFGSDFPQVNIARRGAYKANAQGAAPAPEVPGAPGAAPTPTPTPAPGAGRPDPAITLEVTPEQANRILLAQASGGVLDFVVLPTRGDAVLVDNPQPGTLLGSQLGGVGGLTTISAVTKPQLAPYAERKKSAGGNAASATRVANNSDRSSGSAGRIFETASRNPFSRPRNAAELPLLPPVTVREAPISSLGGSDLGGSNLGNQAAPPAESPTYNIPIYADGRTVRVETVPRPQD